MTKRNTKPAEERVNPALPFTEIEILGETYKLCFTFRAMAAAEAKLRQMRIAANLLRQIPTLTFETIPIVLLAALLTFQPEMTLDRVADMLDYDTIWIVGDQLADAWVAAFPKREPKKGEKENPPQAVPS